MIYLEYLNSFLSGAILPVVLISVGVFLAAKFRFFYILHPIKTIKELKKGGRGGETSPFKALSMALAGTLGVGNISGVATAITAGGAGAVFWMWASALAAMSVKYAEVHLAVKYRDVEITESGVRYHGGACHYMKAGLEKRIGKKAAGVIGSVFAVFLLSNSVLTGNIVQVNAAATVFENVPGIVCGAAIAAVLIFVTSGGVRRIGDFTVRLIPFLTLVYIVLSAAVIIANAGKVPTVICAIVKDAFTFRSAAGGAAGFAVSKAVRYGVTRGIFSNEAGCGTAPTAHAAASAVSPHSQGCLGILEVFCDTVIMCTMTALVILLSGVSGEDGIPLSMSAYGTFFGKAGEWTIGISVIIFALATVICQSYYGMEALRVLGGRKRAARAYLLLSAAASVAGSVMTSATVWQIADLQIALMTVLNSLAVFVLSDDVCCNPNRL